MIEKQEIIEAIDKIFKKTIFFKDFKLKKFSTGEVEWKHTNDKAAYNIGFGFQDRYEGYHLDQFNELIHVKNLESIVQPIFKNHQIETSENEYTLINLSAHKDLYTKIVSTPIANQKALEQVCEWVKEYITIDTIPFFQEKLTYKGMNAQIKDKNIEQLIECGIDASYPASIFKAMAIAYKANDLTYYNAIKTELLEWYETDKADEDEDLSEYGDFEEALKDLDAKLQEDT